MDKQKQVRFPSFYSQFRCIGPSCSDNCCHSWPIEIDKAHYLQYKAEKNADFVPLCAKNVHRIKKDATPAHYARLSLDDRGRCGFQDPDGGCRIIRLLGEEALSTTCAVYPRRKAEFLPGQWELSLSMSCEEAVRIGVLTPQEITFQTEERSFSERDPVYVMESVGIGPKGRIAAPPSWGSALRTVCIHLMQTRELTVTERLMAIVLLLRRLDKQPADQVPQEIIRFLQTVEQGNMSGFFRQLDYNPEAHLAALQIPLGHLIAGRQSPESRRLLLKLQSSFDRDASGGVFAGKNAARQLLENIRSTSDPLLVAHSVWVENYFVNYLFSAMFPFFYRQEGLSFEDHALLLVQQYGLLRCLLSAADEGQTEEDRFLRAVVHTARLAQHGDLAADTRKLSQALGISGSAHLSYLLR